MRIDVPKDLFFRAGLEPGTAVDRFSSDENFFMASATVPVSLKFFGNVARLRDHRQPASSKS